VSPAAASGPSLWTVLPGLLWFALVVVLLFVLRKELRAILTEFAWRLRSGAALKIAAVELGPIVVVPGGEVSQREKEIGVRPDANHVRERERTAYRERAREVMLVHRLYRSREEGQLYDLVIYVVPHKDASLAGVSRVEYFLGWYWGNKIFPSSDRSRGFAIATAAYGPLLCTAEVFFNDGTSVMLHRYIDFEMGSSAPARAAG
jgi:pYEATS domain-containing protein involved in immunity